PCRGRWPRQGALYRLSWQGRGRRMWNRTTDLHHVPRARTMHRSRKTAFTLIELLVVIAVIAVLAAILFPVFASRRGGHYPLRSSKRAENSGARQGAPGRLSLQSAADRHRAA